MKRILPIVILCFAASVFSQADSNDLKLIDSFEDINCESLLARLDNVAIETSKNADAHAYLVMHPGTDPIQNFFYERYLKFYIASKKLDQKRLSIVTTVESPKLNFEFWISTGGKAKPSVEAKTLGMTLHPNVAHYRFVTDTVVARSEGKYVFYGDCSACCIEMVDFGALSKFLSANPRFKARISVFARSRVTASQLTTLLRTEAVDEHGIAKTDLTIVYKGVDKGILALPRNLATVVIDLIARN